MKKSGIRKWVRYVIAAIVILAIMLISAHAFVDLFEREIFDYFIKKIEGKAGGLYSLKYGQVDLNLFKRSIFIKNLSIDLDKKILDETRKQSPAKAILFKTNLPVLTLKLVGISFVDLLLGRSLKVTRLYMEGGELVCIKPRGIQKKEDRIRSQAGGLEDRYEKKAGFVKSVYIRNLKVEKTSFKLVEPDRENPVLGIPEVFLQISRLRIYPNKRAKYFSFRSGEAALSDPCFTFPEGFYRLKAGKLDFSKSASRLTLDNLELMPVYGRYQFARVRGYRVDRVSLKVDRVIFNDPDFAGFFKEQGLHVKLLTIANPRLEIFRDKNVPRSPRPKEKKFPQQLLRELRFKLRIDEIKISRGKITHIEWPERSRRLGKISLTNIQATLKNFTNYAELLKKSTALVLTASGKLMGKSNFKVNMTMPIREGKNRFALSASLAWLDLRVFNDILRYNAFIRIDRGTLKRIYFSIRGDSDKALGEMKATYKNLKISLLKRGGGYKKRKFLSFLANSIIYEENPRPGRPLRVGKIFFKGEKSISFFRYLWESLLTGIKSSIGLKRSKKN